MMELEELGIYEDSENFYLKSIEAAKEIKGEANELLFYQESYGKMLGKMKRYEDAMRVWDEMIESVDHCVPAFIHRQETAHELRNAQLVIDDYYNITRDFPQYANAYVLAADVFSGGVRNTLFFKRNTFRVVERYLRALYVPVFAARGACRVGRHTQKGV